MKLEPNCVRDVLIMCEDTPFLSENLQWNPVRLSFFSQELYQYPKNQIAYTILQLTNANYIDAHVLDSDECIIDIIVYGLTYSGHELIDTIRPEKVWCKIGKLFDEIGNMSLPVLQDIASHFLIELLK